MVPLTVTEKVSVASTEPARVTVSIWATASRSVVTVRFHWFWGVVFSKVRTAVRALPLESKALALKTLGLVAALLGWALTETAVLSAVTPTLTAAVLAVKAVPGFFAVSVMESSPLAAAVTAVVMVVLALRAVTRASRTAPMFASAPVTV